MEASWMDFVLADKMGDMLDELMVLWMARRKEMVTAQVKEILKANMKGCHLAGRMGMQMDRQKTLLMAHQKVGQLGDQMARQKVLLMARQKAVHWAHQKAE
jgi:hypothetical protein